MNKPLVLAPIFYIKAVEDLISAGSYTEAIDSMLENFDAYEPIHDELLRKLVSIAGHFTPSQRAKAALLLRGRVVHPYTVDMLTIPR